MNILEKILESYTEDEDEREPIIEKRGERQIFPTEKVTRCKLTKTALRKFIVWSKSRYNEYKKAEIVEIAYLILSGEWADSIHVYSCGSYCPSSAMTHTGTYLVNGPEKYIATVREVWNSETNAWDLHQTERVEFNV